jgi:hypothetical protein
MKSSTKSAVSFSFDEQSFKVKGAGGTGET